MAGRYWREAATLILVGRAATIQAKNKVEVVKDFNYNHFGRGADYQILFLKRSSKSSFMPDTYVFPGGELDEADLSPNWLSLFKQHGYTEEALVKHLRFSTNNHLELYINKACKHCIPELAFRICALRETFEETGLLLTSTKTSAPNSRSSLFPLESNELKVWRSKVHNNASEFINLMHHINGVPSIFNLHEWNSWLTPTFFKDPRKRFDTAFYITFIDSEIPLYPHDKNEAQELKIVEPIDLLKPFYDSEVFLGPPQVYELLRMLNFTKFDELETFSKHRSEKGMGHVLNVLMQANDGRVMLLPGDDLYPESPDYYGVEDEKTVDKSVDELREASIQLHRFEHNNKDPVQLVIKNLKQDNGHITPISWSEISQS